MDGQENNNHSPSHIILSSENDSVIAKLTQHKDSTTIKHNENFEVKKYSAKDPLDLNNFSEEEERLNRETWQYFEEFTTVVDKVERLSDIVDQIQALLNISALKTEVCENEENEPIQS